MATFGKIDQFDEALETWIQYTERLDQYFIANEIDNMEKKRAIFLTVIGPGTFGLLRSLVAPRKVHETAYNDLVHMLKEQFNPRPSEIVERYKFYSRSRKQGESITTFVSELRKIAEFCNYGQTLDTMLRDRIVCGVQDDQIQRRLLAEPVLTLTRAIEIGLAMESAAKNVQDLQTNSLHSTNYVRNGKQTVKHNTPSTTGQLISKRNGGNHKHELPVTDMQPNHKICMRCGQSNHSSTHCKHKNTTCRGCGKLGHLSKVCITSGHMSLPPKRIHNSKVHTLQETTQPEIDSEITNKCSNEYAIFQLSSRQEVPPPMHIKIFVNGIPINMEIDSGAAHSIIGHTSYISHKEQFGQLQESHIRLATYTGQPINVVGQFQAKLQYGGKKTDLSLLVVENGSTNLCGRNLIQVFDIFKMQFVTNIPEVPCGNLANILEKHKAVFEPKLGLVKDVEVHLHQKPNITPKFHAPRSVPYALRQMVSDQIDYLVKNGVLEPVKVSQWAAPIVPILKKDKKSVRICGDFKLTANKATDTEQYPLPRVQDLFAKLSGGQKFTKLDLRDAYNQLSLDEESRDLLVINTLSGLFRYTRLPFGVSSASAAFQRCMDNLLKGTDYTVAFQDDCLVTGKNDMEHLSNLDIALSRIESAGMTLRLEKCEFMLESVGYLGHEISKEGIKPSTDKLDAITKAPAPNNVHELKSFIGLITYYAKFIPNMSTVLAPLYNLTKDGHHWKWTSEEETAFERVKAVLTSSNVLTHFDPDKKLMLQCDASPTGIGAVLSQNEQGGDKPIAFASRTLATAERNYSQIEREALAIIFGVHKFRDYILGKRFILYTDHQPLTTLFSERKSFPSTASARIQRWAITLSAYDYEIKYRPGSQNANADALSRLPLPVLNADPPEPNELVLLMQTINRGPITADQLRKATESDKDLCELSKLIKGRWPVKLKLPDRLKLFWNRRNELAVQNSLIVWHNRVLIPTSLRSWMLEELHSTHGGITALKRTARTHFWWPGIDKDIENYVATCNECQAVAPSPKRHIYQWPKETEPWTRLHIDYAGPTSDGKMVLIIIDVNTKWIDAQALSHATSIATINHLRSLFSVFGVPQSLVSDNGSPFTSHEFSEFTRRNGINHIKTPPYHPSSNGSAERAVRTIKTALRKMHSSALQTRLDRYLYGYRNTPSSNDGSTPASKMLSYKPRSRLDLLNLSAVPQSTTTTGEAVLKFHPGQPVWIRDYSGASKWTKGTVKVNKGQALIDIATDKGAVSRHVDQVRPRKELEIIVAPVTPISGESFWDDIPYNVAVNSNLANNVHPVAPPNLRASTRARKPPTRLNL